MKDKYGNLLRIDDYVISDFKEVYRVFGFSGKYVITGNCCYSSPYLLRKITIEEVILYKLENI